MSHAVRLPSLVLLAIAALVPWSAARAATLQLVLDKPFYHPGETVTITLLGDSQGASDFTLFASFPKPDPAILSDLSLQRFAPPTSDGVPWTQGGASCITHPTECILVNMIHAAPPGAAPVGVDPSLEPFTYAVLTGVAGVPGLHPLEFGTVRVNPRSGVDFFGLTSAPSATLVIVNPEPGTAALLALGLVGLTIGRRRRARP